MFYLDSLWFEVRWYRKLWVEYLDQNTNVFQCTGNLPRLQRIVKRVDLNQRAKRALPHLFNFAYGANPHMLISERSLPEFEDGAEERLEAYDLATLLAQDGGDCFTCGLRGLRGSSGLAIRKFASVVF